MTPQTKPEGLPDAALLGNLRRCDNCHCTHNILFEGITTSDGLELCMNCQPQFRASYDENWQLLPNAEAVATASTGAPNA